MASRKQKMVAFRCLQNAARACVARRLFKATRLASRKIKSAIRMSALSSIFQSKRKGARILQFGVVRCLCSKQYRKQLKAIIEKEREAERRRREEEDRERLVEEERE